MKTPAPLRILSIMAHQDDFELNLGGTFALLRRTLGDQVRLKVLATSAGASGHHQLPPDETFIRRQEEARRAAELVDAEYECLRQLDGSHVPGQVIVDRNLLGGLWNAIRAFEADVIFCPPVASDPLAGVHIDHDQTAIAVRYVTYQLSVPHAYPDLHAKDAVRYDPPLVINVDDPYINTAGADIRQNISDVYDLKVRMTLCHESQVLEWLPYNGGWGPQGATKDEWTERLRQRHLSANLRYGCNDNVMSEFFLITRWGRAPREGELDRLFPRQMGD
jgi:LmbE family N-acetylglucosaminyl deacetylase